RASDGWDACDGFLHLLYSHLPTLTVPASFSPKVGGSIKGLSNNPSHPSHPSPVRSSAVTHLSHPSLVRANGGTPSLSPAIEPQSATVPGVGEWVWLVSEDAVVQNTAPYRIQQIEFGPDGERYARFAETATGWRLTQCERTDPPAAVPFPSCVLCRGIDRWN